MIDTVLPYLVGAAGIFTGVGGWWISNQQLNLNKLDMEKQQEQLTTFKTNCIATLNEKVRQLEDVARKHDENFKQLFESQRQMIKQLSELDGYIRGKFNGNSPK